MEKHNFRLGEEVSSGEEKLIFSPFSSSRSGKEGEESIKKFPVIDSSTFFFLDAADSGQFFSWTSVAFWEGNRNKSRAIYRISTIFWRFRIFHLYKIFLPQWIVPSPSFLFPLRSAKKTCTKKIRGGRSLQWTEHQMNGVFENCSIPGAISRCLNSF